MTSQILHSRRSRARRLAPLAGVLLALLTASPALAAGNDPPTSTADTLVSNVLTSYAGPFGPYANGTWTTTDTTCWACDQGGPATGAATAYVVGGETNTTLRQEAVDTIDTAIATHQAADGSFPDPGNGGGADISTMFFGVEEGTTYYLLAPTLDAATRAAWQQSLAAAADYLIKIGAPTYYSNGNINLGEVEFFYLAWQATGNTRYDQAYETAWTTALTPNQTRWPGAGLVITRQPTQADGSDGAGYLAEIGVGGTGFDAEYTELQLDAASRLYLLSRDPRALRLANLEANQLLPRVNSQWMLDTSGGTRHPEAGRTVNFLTSALTVLSLFGGRSDLATQALGELQSEQTAYAQTGQAYNPVFRRALGNDLSVSALAAYLNDGQVAVAAKHAKSKKKR